MKLKHILVIGLIFLGRISLSSDEVARDSDTLSISTDNLSLRDMIEEERLHSGTDLRAGVKQDIALLMKKLLADMTANENNLYVARSYYLDQGIGAEAKKAIESASDKPYLGAIPDIDIHTYNECILQLNEKFREACKSQDNQQLALIAYTWSYICGIPVVAVKRSAEEYFYNLHFKTTHDERIELSHKKIELVDVEGKKVKSRGTPYELLSLYALRSFNENKRAKEIQKIVWELLEEELVPLSECSTAQLIVFLANVLKLDLEMNPAHCFGVIKLLSNTAIYLSQSNENENDSKLILTPCTVKSLNYLGFQDGMFIGKKCADKKINRLFGQQLFARAFYESASELKNFDDKSCPYFCPQYTIPEDLVSKFKKKNIVKSGRMYDLYIRQKDDTPETRVALKKLCRLLDSHQLKERLITKKELLKNLSQDLFFTTAGPRVDLSRKVKINALFADSSAGISDEDIPDLILHMKCLEFQNIQSLLLRKNYITLQGARKIAHVLALNYLPHLEILDLSENEIYEPPMKDYLPLLTRKNFRFLAIYHQSRGKEPEQLSEDCQQKLISQKLIWMGEPWFRFLQSRKQIPNDVAKAHQIFYSLLSLK